MFIECTRQISMINVHTNLGPVDDDALGDGRVRGEDAVEEVAPAAPHVVHGVAFELGPRPVHDLRGRERKDKR